MAEATVGKIKAVITADSSGLSQAVTSAQKSLDSLGSTAETTAGQVEKVTSALKPEAVSADVTQASQALEVLTSSANATEEQLSEVSSGVNGQEIVNETTKGQEGIKELGEATEQQTARMNDSFKKLTGVLMTAFATQKLVGFVKESVKGASDLGEAINVTNEIFESGAQKVKDFASKAANSIGQSTKTALDGANTFATFGKSAGLAGNELSDFAIRFSGLASDLASFRNTTPEDAIQAIGAALRGESEPIRRYGVMLNEASLQAVAFREGIIKTSKEALTPQQRVLAASAAIFEQTKDAQGDFARTSDGLANSSRTLNAQISDLKAGMGEALLPTVQALVGAVNPLIAGFNNMDETSKSVISTLGLVVAGAVLAQRALKFLEIEMVNAAGEATALKVAFTGFYAVAAGVGLGFMIGEGINKITGATDDANTALQKLLGTLDQTNQYSTIGAFADLTDEIAGTWKLSNAWEMFGKSLTINGVSHDIEDYDAAFKKVMESGPGAGQAVVDSLKAWASAQAALTEETGIANPELDDYNQLIARFEGQLALAANAEAGLAAVTDEGTTAVMSQADALSGAAQDFQTYRDAILGVSGATKRDFRVGINEAISGNNSFIQSMTSGKVTSQEFENALIKQSDEMLKLQFSTKGQIDKLKLVAPAMRGMIESMYAAGKAQGHTRGETTALIEQLGLLDGLDPRIAIYMTMDITQLKAQAANLEKALASARRTGNMAWYGSVSKELKSVVDMLDMVEQVQAYSPRGGGGGGSSKADSPFAWIEQWVADITDFANDVISKNWAKGIISGSSAEVADALQATIEKAISLLPNAPTADLVNKKNWIVGLLGVRETKLKELDAAKAKLTELKNALQKVQQASDNYKESIRASIAQPLKYDEQTGPLAQTKAILSAAREFKTNIAALRSAGFPTSVIQEVANAGLTNGNALAKQLLSMSGDDFKEFISAREEIAAIAAETGTTLADLVFGADITAAQKLVNDQTTATNDLIDTLNLVGGMITDSVTGFQNTIAGLASSFTGGSGSATNPGYTNIPHMASGGIVSSATLALIGESGAEAVVPLDRMGSFGGGQTVYNDIVINMPPGSDGKDVVAAIQDYNRRFGPAPFNTRSF